MFWGWQLLLRELLPRGCAGPSGRSKAGSMKRAAIRSQDVFFHARAIGRGARLPARLLLDLPVLLGQLLSGPHPMPDSPAHSCLIYGGRTRRPSAPARSRAGSASPHHWQPEPRAVSAWMCWLGRIVRTRRGDGAGAAEQVLPRHHGDGRQGDGHQGDGHHSPCLGLTALGPSWLLLFSVTTLNNCQRGRGHGGQEGL